MNKLYYGKHRDSKDGEINAMRKSLDGRDSSIESLKRDLEEFKLKCNRKFIEKKDELNSRLGSLEDALL